MRLVPFSTTTSRPSTWSFTVGIAIPLVERAAAQRAALLADVLQELVPELLREAARRPGRRVSERADRVPLDLIGDGEEDVEIPLLALSGLDLLEDALHPAAPLATGGALAARLVREEARRDPGRAHHAGGVVHDHRRAGPEERARPRQRVEVHGDVDLVAAEHRAGRAARNDPLHRTPAGDAAAVLVDERAERDPHGRFVYARAIDVAAQAVELGPGVPVGADAGEPLPAPLDDVRHAGEGLDVVDHGRAAEESDDGRE